MTRLPFWRKPPTQGHRVFRLLVRERRFQGSGVQRKQHLDVSRGETGAAGGLQTRSDRLPDPQAPTTPWPCTLELVQGRKRRGGRLQRSWTQQIQGWNKVTPWPAWTREDPENPNGSQRQENSQKGFLLAEIQFARATLEDNVSHGHG